MTVILVGCDRYEGLEGDTKPTTSLVTNVIFEETDTGRIFKWTGSVWEDISKERYPRADTHNETYSSPTGGDFDLGYPLPAMRGGDGGMQPTDTETALDMGDNGIITMLHGRVEVPEGEVRGTFSVNFEIYKNQTLQSMDVNWGSTEVGTKSTVTSPVSFVDTDEIVINLNLNGTDNGYVDWIYTVAWEYSL